MDIKYGYIEVMHTRSLRSLVKISQVHSFRDAAEQLGMTLSALSMQMKSLENVLGVDLFDRSVRPPRLTPIGRAIVGESVLLLRHEDNLVDVCRPGDDLAGRFRLGFVTTAAVRLLPEFLRASSQELPRASFEFETGLSATLQSKVRFWIVGRGSHYRCGWSAGATVVANSPAGTICIRGSQKPAPNRFA